MNHNIKLNLENKRFLPWQYMSKADCSAAVEERLRAIKADIAPLLKADTQRKKRRMNHTMKLTLENKRLLPWQYMSKEDCSAAVEERLRAIKVDIAPLLKAETKRKKRK